VRCALVGDGLRVVAGCGPGSRRKDQWVEQLRAEGHEVFASEGDVSNWDSTKQAFDRVKAEHGIAIVWDAHSIVSLAPRLFEGRLADFNLGTADGASCDRQLAESLAVALGRQVGYTSVLNGRFKGGYITRQYGAPARGVHAVQLEMAEATYMDEASPYSFRPERAQAVRQILREQLGIVLDWARQRSRPPRV
jgi:N-formylglutamate amidohydrolase